MQNLPSKKLFFVVIPIIVMLAFVISIRRGAVAGTSVQKAELSTIGGVDRASGETDTDSDGLKDWEEVLWRMDPKKADTDSNGILDGQEVEMMKARGEQPSSQMSSVTASTTVLTRTDLLTKKLFSDYMNLKQNGAVTSKDLQSIASRGVSTLYAEKSENVYVMKDLNVQLGVTSQADTLTFANKATSVFLKLSSKKEVLGGLVGINIESKQYGIATNAIADVYSNLAKSLLALQVPKELSITYLTLINTYARTAIEFRNLGHINEDPALAASALQKIQNYQTEQENALAVIGKFFESQNIIPLADGSGYKAK